MKPGPELDEKAHILMGWKKHQPDKLGVILWENPSGNVVTSNGPLPYSTEIKAAWLLAEKVGITVIPVRCPADWDEEFDGKWGKPTGWMATPAKSSGPDEDYYEIPVRRAKVYESAAEAICRVALKAAGVEVPA